MTLDKNPKLLR